MDPWSETEDETRSIEMLGHSYGK